MDSLLKELKLARIRMIYKDYIEKANKDEISYYDFLKNLTIKAKDVDIKRAQDMLSYPWINRHKEWVKELKTVIKTKKKLEQDALQGPKLSFIGDYLREKISENKLLP